MKVSAVIFDLDGTLIDSEEVWGKAFVAVLTSLGITPDNKHPEVSGISVKDNWKSLITKYNIKTEKNLDELRSLTYVEYEKLLPEISLRDGAVEFIENLKNEGIQIALATSTAWQTVDKVLQEFRMVNLFDSISTGDEVTNEKPDPEIYILASDKMNLEPDDCLAIEDSPSGVTAAKEAGMKVIAIDPTGERSDLEEADRVVGSYSEISAQMLGEL